MIIQELKPNAVLVQERAIMVNQRIRKALRRDEVLEMAFYDWVHCLK